MKSQVNRQQLVESTRSFLDSTQISFDEDTLRTWGCDWTRSFAVAPLAVVFPKTTEQVSALIRLAPDLKIQLVPSGGRTGLSGGAVASNGEVVVSLDRMNSILAFNPIDRMVRCQAGVITANLQDFARQNNLYYPVDFSSAGSSHIGGNVATNAGGIRVIRYGLTRDAVAGLTVVTGTGEVLQLNNGLIKNATGYDLRHLFIGSEGTLGIVVEAEIRLIPPPEPQQVMVLGVNHLSDMLSILETFHEKIDLSSFEFFSDLAMQKVIDHRGIAKPFDQSTQFYTLLEYDVSAEDTAVAAFNETIDAGWVSDGVISQSEAQSQALWALRDGITESIASYSPYKNDVSVPIAEIPEFLSEVDSLVASNYPDFEVCWFGHIGDGNLHLNILKPSTLSIDEFYQRCHSISPRLFEKIQSHGGSISAEHGVGLLKRDFLSYTRSPSEIELMRKLKDVFDPYGIMNPGKLLVPRAA